MKNAVWKVTSSVNLSVRELKTNPNLQFRGFMTTKPLEQKYFSIPVGAVPKRLITVRAKNRAVV